MKIVVGISGASGVILGYELLKALKEQNVETHLVVTKSAKLTWTYETDLEIERLLEMADYVYLDEDLSARIASGSVWMDGMIICPCSMKTLAGIVTGYSDHLLLRAADVTLKEQRKLVLVPRETPLGKVHLRNMSSAAELGCILIPPVLTFYRKQNSLQAQIDHIVGKILRQFQLSSPRFRQWQPDLSENGSKQQE